MIEYPKIQSIFKRDEKTHKFIEGAFTLPEFEYLKENIWIYTEKLDGTNCRIEWNPHYPDSLSDEIKFGGRTNNAQMPVFLFDKLRTMFTIEKIKSLYPDISMTLFGEAIGAKIQKGGGNYIPNGVDFILFDVLIDNYWLKRDSMEDIANKIGIRIVPIIGEGTLQRAIDLIKKGLKSQWGNFWAEGLVLKPKIELKDRRGQRIITKLKRRDFSGLDSGVEQLVAR